MKRSMIAAVAMVLLTSVACSSQGAPDETTPQATDRSDVVEIRLIAFRPDTLQVPVGTTVTWKQLDAGFHTVTSGHVTHEPSGSVETDPDGAFASGQLAKAAEFEHTFEDARAYEYFCEIHPATMNGRVTVQ